MGNHEQMTHVQRTERIRELNDRLRRQHQGGRVVMTRGVQALPLATLARLLFSIRDHRFEIACDDASFGRVEVDGHSAVFWIRCWDADLEAQSPDPSDETLTAREMTIALASEA